MLTNEQLNDQYNELKILYFKTHFLNKNIHTAIYKSLEDSVITLTAAQAKFILTLDCLKILKHNKKFFNKLTPESQTEIRILIIILRKITKNIDDILRPIAQGMQED